MKFSQKKITAFVNKIEAVFVSIKNPHLFVLDYFGLLSESKKSIYDLGNGYIMLARNGTKDKGEIAMVISGFEYPFQLLDFLDEKSVVFDIGAHIGSFICFLNKNVKVSKIYAFEPFDENFEILSFNVSQNNFQNVQLINSCIGDYDGYCNIDISVDTDAIRIIDDYSEKKHNSYKEVQIISLQTFCEHHEIDVIDLIKMDCEGYEYKILQKSSDFIKKHVRNVIMEVHDLDSVYNTNYIINAFSSMGFQLKQLKRTKNISSVLFFQNDVLIERDSFN